MAEDRELTVISRRRWSDRLDHTGQMTGTLRGILRVLGRRKWIILLTFLVTAAALWAAFVFRVKEEAVCLVGVKKPSQMFVPLGQAGTAVSASVPLLEGQNYKEVTQTVAFLEQVARSLIRTGRKLSPDDIAARLQVEFRDPDLLRFKGFDKDPTTAVLISNAACQTLVAINKAQLQANLQESVNSITRLLAEAGKEVESAGAGLADYIQKEGLLNTDFSSGASELYRTLEVISQQEVARATAQAMLESAQKRLKAMSVQEGAPVAKLAFPVQDPAIAYLALEVGSVRSKLWEALKHYTDAHPVVADLRTRLAELERELEQQIRKGRVAQDFRPSAEHELAIKERIIETSQEIAKYQAEIAARSRLVEEQRRSLGMVPGQWNEVERLKRSMAFAEDRYRTLSRKLDETRVSLESAEGTLSIVQLATDSELPNISRRILIALILLFVVPLGLAMLLEYLDSSVQNPVLFARELGLQCLASVPKSRHLRASDSLRNGSSAHCLVPFQVLRSGIRVAAGDTPTRTIAVVGAKRRVGRSTLILHLSRALVDDGKRVMIVDADLRSPTNLARRLRIKTEGGLLEVLMGERRLDEVLDRTWFSAGLVPARAEGRDPPLNAEVLFQSRQFIQLVHELRLQNDVVLFDTPPLFEYADTLELLPNMDGVLIVVEASNESKEDVQRMIDLLRSCRARALGLVLNKVQNGW